MSNQFFGLGFRFAEYPAPSIPSSFDISSLNPLIFFRQLKYPTNSESQISLVAENSLSRITASTMSENETLPSQFEDAAYFNHRVITLLDSILSDARHIIAPEQTSRLAPPEVSMALQLLKTTAEATWKVVDKARLEAVTANSTLIDNLEKGGPALGGIGGEMTTAGIEELRAEIAILKAEAANAVAQKESMAIKLQKMKAERERLRRSR